MVKRDSGMAMANGKLPGPNGLRLLQNDGHRLSGRTACRQEFVLRTIRQNAHGRSARGQAARTFLWLDLLRAGILRK